MSTITNLEQQKLRLDRESASHKHGICFGQRLGIESAITRALGADTVEEIHHRLVQLLACAQADQDAAQAQERQAYDALRAIWTVAA